MKLSIVDMSANVINFANLIKEHLDQMTQTEKVAALKILEAMQSEMTKDVGHVDDLGDHLENIGYPAGECRIRTETPEP